MAGRRLSVVATARPRRLSRAQEELGDSVYLHDSTVEINIDERSPLLYVHSVLQPDRLFRIVVSEPPAYVERLVPVHFLASNIGEVVEWILDSIDVWSVGHAVNVEVKPRGYFLKGSRKAAAKTIISMLSDRDVYARRKAGYTLKIEDTRYGIVVAFMRSGWDRMSFWRRRRLGVFV